MLLKNPKQFAEVAKAWVIQYAGVKPGDTSPKFGESSGVVKEVDPAKAAREAEAARLAAYDLLLDLENPVLTGTDIVATPNLWSTAFVIWVSKYHESLPLSKM